MSRPLRACIDGALLQCLRLAGDETWRGPRADDVLQDLLRLRNILELLHDRELRSGAGWNAVGDPMQALDLRRPWES